jgi:hypothetical protein
LGIGTHPGIFFNAQSFRRMGALDDEELGQIVCYGRAGNRRVILRGSTFLLDRGFSRQPMHHRYLSAALGNIHIFFGQLLGEKEIVALVRP